MVFVFGAEAALRHWALHDTVTQEEIEHTIGILDAMRLGTGRVVLKEKIDSAINAIAAFQNRLTDRMPTKEIMEVLHLYQNQEATLYPCEMGSTTSK